MRRLALIALVLPMLLSACGGDDDGGNPKTSSGGDKAPVANIGNRALALGEARVGAAAKTTVFEVLDPYPASEHRRPDPGTRFFGIRLETCMEEDLDDDGYYATHEGDFSVRDAEGNIWQDTGSHWIDFPQPHFPASRSMSPGECVSGWLAIGLPTDVTPVTLEWSPGMNHVADWKLPDLPEPLTIGEACTKIEATEPATPFGFPGTRKAKAAYVEYQAQLHGWRLDEDAQALTAEYFAAVDYSVADHSDELLPNVEISQRLDRARADLRVTCKFQGSPIWE